jgi:hypothetical protein
MEPAYYEMFIHRDRDFSRVFTFKSAGATMILDGYSAKAQIRTELDDGELLADFTTAINAAAGTVTVSLPAALSAAIENNSGFWDLMLVDPNGLRQTYVEGLVTIKGTVTRVGGGVGVGG